MRLIVTGGSGKLGRTVVRDLREAGHDVLSIDRVGERGPGFLRVDLGDYGQVVDAIAGFRDADGDGNPLAGAREIDVNIDAIIHLGAIPAPGIVPEVATFHNNMSGTFNVFWAAVRLGVRRIVYASSETVLGLPFETPPPYIPVDEDYPARPESVYSLVKHLEEQMAIELVRWYPDLSITALRFSNVLDVEDYADFPGYQDDVSLRQWNLWAYVDGRDAAQAVRLAAERAPVGFDRFIVAAADSVMLRSNAELVAEVFPDVPLKGELGEHDTMLSIAKARRLLGYEPQHSWRD